MPMKRLGNAGLRAGLRLHQAHVTSVMIGA